MMAFTDDHFMKEAYKQAEKAEKEGEVPIGCVITIQNQLIAKAYNQVERLHDATAHAEMLAITAAEHYLGSKYLDQCTLYVTLEPCLMCASACSWTQLGKLVIGAGDPQRGYSILYPSALHTKTVVVKNVYQEACQHLITNFFKKIRK